MALDFRSDLFNQLQRLSLAFHEPTPRGHVHVRQPDGPRPRQPDSWHPGLTQNVLTLVAMFWITFALDWHAGAGLAGGGAVPVLLVDYYVKRIQSRIYEVRAMEGEALSIIHEAVSMLRVDRRLCRETYEHRRFRDQSKRAIDARLRLTMRANDLRDGRGHDHRHRTALVLGFGAYHVLDRRLTVGDLTVILFYIGMVYKPLEAISSTVGGLQDTFVTLKMTFDLLDVEPDIQDSPGPSVLRGPRGT